MQYIHNPRVRLISHTIYLLDPAPAQIFVWHNSKFYQLGKRDVQRILGMVVETCNIYKILARVIYNTLLLRKCLSGTNHNYFLWGEKRKLLGIVVGTCNIYTVLARYSSTTP